MTDPHEPDDDEKGSQAVRDLVKRSLSTRSLTEHPPDLVMGVQRRLRKRSRGKFFADGWSTTQARTSHVLVAFATILLVALAYYALGPMDIR